MAKKRYTSGGRGGTRSAAKRKPRKRKASTAGKIVLAAVTFCNLILGILTSVMNRREVLHAIREDEDVKLLFTARETTREGSEET